MLYTGRSFPFPLEGKKPTAQYTGVIPTYARIKVKTPHIHKILISYATLIFTTLYVRASWHGVPSNVWQGDM